MKYWNYDSLAKIYDETREIPSQLYVFFTNEITEYIRSSFSPPFSLLSIGIGTGRIESLLSSKNFQLFGVDIAREMLGKLKSKRINPPIYPIQADGLVLPFSKSFHAILLIQIVHLIETIEEFVKEIKQFSSLLIVGNAYTETEEHPIYKEFFQILYENGWESLEVDEPKQVSFDKCIEKYKPKKTIRSLKLPNSIKHSQIYRGLRNRSFRSLFHIEDDIFNKSIHKLDLFISEKKINLDEVYETKSSVNLTFYDFS